MLLTETNILNAVYCHNRLGYDIVYSKATVNTTGGFQGGVGLFSLKRIEEWIVESTRFHGLNMVI